MSLSKLSKLPNEVLSNVLNNPAIPLVRRLHLRLLSNRWCDIIEDGLKKETSLAIRKGDRTDRKRNPNVLFIKSGWLTEELNRVLVRLFSGITELTLAILFYDHLPSSLIAHMSTNLTTVKLYGHGIVYPAIEPLARALVTLSGLTCLTLNDYELTACVLPRLESVLSRLERFACPYSGNMISRITSSSLSPRCTHLLLHHYVFTDFSGPFLAQLSTSLTHLHLVKCGKTPNWQSLSQIHRLTSLTLSFTNSKFNSSLFSHLAPFTNLTHLKLYRLQFGAPLALPWKKEAPLPGIKTLTLNLFIYPYSIAAQFDSQLFCQTIGVWFPSLTHFTLITLSENIPAMRAKLGKLPFEVEILDRNPWSLDW